jgi:dienelactone hydrolase
MSGRHARPGAGPRPSAVLPVVVALLLAIVAVRIALGRGGPEGAVRSPTATTSSSLAPTETPTPTATPSATPEPPSTYRVLVARFRFADHRRVVSVGAGDEPRTLPTTVWYPDVPGGTAENAAFPLVVFAHGFDLFPSTYERLLRDWARAGYVVAAPVFPRTNPDAVGGLDESDIVNQPGDVRFVITQLLRRSRSTAGPLAGRIDPSEIAVAGHSDGGETAMAVAYDTCCRDRRVRAAIVMAGAQLAIPGGRYPNGSGPPLLAIQGTDDVINAPSATATLFDGAPAPKYLLWLRGADHLGPFSTAGRYLGVVRRVTVAFLDRFLNGATTRIRVPPSARAAGIATLRSVA